MMQQPPPMMPMHAYQPGPMIPPPIFDPMHHTMMGGIRMSTSTPQGMFSTMSDAGVTAQQTMASSRFEETERKNKAKIELLEKKIRAKD